VSLLELRNVCKSYGHQAQAHVVLKDVCLELDGGEMATIWGGRRSGRSTFLRVAAGIEPPDRGTVLFEGHDISRPGAPADLAAIAYCHPLDGLASAQSVYDLLIKSPLSRGVDAHTAEQMVHTALERAGADECAEQGICALDRAERVRVQVARALLRSPKLIVIDEPTLGASLEQREELIRLLRSLVDEGIAVLQSTDNETFFLGADRALTIDRGILRGEICPPMAEVLPLRRPA